MAESLPTSAAGPPLKSEKGHSGPCVPVVVFAARSQAEEPGKDSTGDQVALILRRVDREPGRFVYGEPHVDHASGSKRSRGPGLEAAIRDAQRAVAEHGLAELWAWHSSRFGRGSGKLGEARAVGKLFYDMRAVGVALRTVEDDEFVTNEMLVGFASRQASKYAEDLAANVKRGINSNVRDGKPWGEPAYGYEKGDDGHWRPEPAERAVVERIYRERVEQGRAYSAIAKGLNREPRVPTRRGAEWSPTVVQRVLTSRAVLGEFEHVDHVEGCRKPAGRKQCSCPRKWHRGRHEAIVDEDTWLAAQVVAERGRRYAPRGSGRVPKRHLFIKGMLRCGVCGAAMLPRSAPPGQADTYVCRTRKQTGGADACPMPTLPRRSVEYAALQLFMRWALDLEGTRERIAGATDARLAEVRAQAERAAGEALRMRRALDKAERDYAENELGAANFERLTAQWSEELRAAEAERERLDSHAERVREAGAALAAEEDVVRRVSDLYEAVVWRVQAASAAAEAQADVAPLRAALAQVFERVVVRWPEPTDLDDATVFEVPGVRGWPHLEPVLRADVVAGGAELRAEQFARIRRVALDLGVDPDGLRPGADPRCSAENNSTGTGVPL